MNCASSFFGIPVVRQCLSSRLLEGGRPLGGGFGDVQVMKRKHKTCWMLPLFLRVWIWKFGEMLNKLGVFHERNQVQESEKKAMVILW